MEQNNRAKSIIANLFWRFAERSGAQSVAFIVSVILARLLSPNDYGTIALITVFTTILQVFVDSGLGNALIQKKDTDDLDFSTVFFTNIIFCSILYASIFFSAPLISSFYDRPDMVPYIRVLGLTVVISGVKNVQQAYVSKNLLFKRFFFATLGGTITAAIIGIAMAYHGFGVWALVMQQVINLSMDTLILWLSVKWRPQMKFSFERLKKLYSFGWKLLVSYLLDTVYSDIRQLIIGKMYSAVDLAYFNQGQRIPNLVVTNINSSIDSVLFPTMSKAQDDRQHIKNMTRRAIKISIYVLAPMMMGLAFTANPLISMVLTEKWLPCVPFLRIFCITYMFWPIHTANLNAIKAMGRSDLFLKLEIMKMIVGVVLLLSTMWFGVMAMAYSLLVSSVLSQIINSSPNKKLLGYSYLSQLKDILPSVLLASFMGVCIYPISRTQIPMILVLILQLFLGAAIYIAGSVLLKLDSFQYLWEIVRPILKRKKN